MTLAFFSAISDHSSYCCSVMGRCYRMNFIGASQTSDLAKNPRHIILWVFRVSSACHVNQAFLACQHQNCAALIDA